MGTQVSKSHELEHDHEVRRLAPMTRRRFLMTSAASAGVVLTSGLIHAAPLSAATKKINLPGFSSFAESVKTLRSGKYFLVESSGLPLHNMMVGISNWQQQVPVPMPYTGSNAWRIPVNPKKASDPISLKTELYRGAVALAVNGVPIFNALNNRGEDAFLIGELDAWGGHCGRADDYHYHIAPLHLSKTVGKRKPIAYALDGYKIYGRVEPNGSKMRKLDEFNGHIFKGEYHYHGTTSYPYINGGMRGQVTVRNGQIEPQASTRPFRPPGKPLRGAVITNFERQGELNFSLSYTLNGSANIINYVANQSSVTMQFSNPDGSSTTEIYERKDIV